MKLVSYISLATASLLSVSTSSGSGSGSGSGSATALEEERRCHTEQLREEYPVLCQMLDRLHEDPEKLSNEIHEWAASRDLLVTVPPTSTVRKNPSAATDDQLPVVFAHGMGDSCFNDGMQHITAHASDLLGGVYATCVATGKDKSEDTSNGYFLNMDASVDIFAASVRDNPNLQDGFQAIGFSQGCNVIRGYIARYNDPPVNAFLAVNGVNGGEGAVPYCIKGDVSNSNNTSDSSSNSNNGGFCDLLMEQASKRAYTEWYQQHSFQANYWRDPRPSQKEAYQTFSQLAQWNNEGKVFNQTLKDNWAKTNKFVWVKANKDGLVWPAEGEHWGAPDPADPFNHILPMNQTEWYIQDLFGLKTAQEAGKNYFESFDGDHLQFPMEDFDRWVQAYLSMTTQLAVQ